MPDASGNVGVEGAQMWWERCGSGEPALLLMGVDPIVDSQMWKGQVAWFARRHTVLTFDPPGNGRSARTADPRVYSDEAFMAASLAVLDANAVERAVLVGVCNAAGVALMLAADHADRVAGVVAINPGMALSRAHEHRRRRPGQTFDDVLDIHDGWAKENRHHWLADWDDYADFFFDQLLPEPHSTKHHEDCTGWAAATTGQQMLAYCDCDPPSPRGDEQYATDVCRRVRCPVLVINGDADMCQPPERSRRVADLTGAELVVMEGSGHLPHARDPVKVNLEIARFVRRLPV